jgi:anti-anti-sigma factor
MENYLSVVVSDRRDGTVLALSGELDLGSSPQLAAALDRLERGGSDRMILDLAELEFIDVTGLRLLLRVHERVSQHGGELVLVNVRAAVHRLLKLTGTTELLAVIQEG